MKIHIERKSVGGVWHPLNRSTGSDQVHINTSFSTDPVRSVMFYDSFRPVLFFVYTFCLDISIRLCSDVSGCFSRSKRFTLKPGNVLYGPGHR